MRLAARAFGTQGYPAMTMRSIAEQAGIEAASIYYHFSSKEDLIDAVMAHSAESIFQHTRDHLEALPADATTEERFKAALVGLLSALVKYGDYALAHGLMLAQLPEKVRERQIKRREQHQEFWHHLLKDLQAEGSLREDADLALCRVFILSAITSAQTWFNPKKGSPEKVVDELCAIFFEGGRPRDKATPARRSELVAP